MLKQKLIGLFTQTQVLNVKTAPHIADWNQELSQACVALVTTAGVHVIDQPVFEVESGDSSYRVIPGDTPTERLMTSHTHFDRTEVNKDINCVFPLDRLRELKNEEKIGRVASHHFGLQGYIPDATQLIEKVGPEIAQQLVLDGVDIVILSPG